VEKNYFFATRHEVSMFRMKEQSIIEKTADHSSVVLIISISSTNRKALFVFQILLNHCIQGHRPFAMQAELGVVRLQRHVTSVRQQNPSDSHFSTGNQPLFLEDCLWAKEIL